MNIITIKYPKDSKCLGEVVENFLEMYDVVNICKFDDGYCITLASNTSDSDVDD
jgi:hypothetical protein